MRQALLEKISNLLERNGFFVSTFFASNSCFDIIAKKPGTGTIILKALENIDAIRSGQAAELERLAEVFGCSALIVGEKTKAFRLNDNTVYSRYGIYAVSFATLENFFSGRIPEISYFKGKEIVELDPELLRRKRLELQLSYASLADSIGTTMETLYRYEQGNKASLEMAKRLEDFFGQGFVKEIDFFGRREKAVEEKGSAQKLGTNENKNDLAKQLEKLGANVSVFRHATFHEAALGGKEKLVISEAASKREILRKAPALEKTGSALEAHSVIFVDSQKDAEMRGLETPLMEKEEIASVSKFKDIIRLIKEKKKD